MCRLLAFASSELQSLETLLTPDEISNYQNLSTLHCDGWGGAWQGSSDEAPELFNSVKRAIDDSNFVDNSKKMSRGGIIHIRWATTGFPVVVENTHPFINMNWTFAHNGSIADSSKLRSLLSAERLSQLKGDTDSELYFQLILQHLDNSEDIEFAIKEAIKDIRKLCGQGSLNCLMLNNKKMIAVQAFDQTPAPIETLIDLVGGVENLPAGHDENYYRLQYCIKNNSVLVGSTGFAGKDWKFLNDDSILTFNYVTKELSISSLESNDDRQLIQLK